MKAYNERRLAGSQESPPTTMRRVKYSNYQRARILMAIIEALHQLTPNRIKIAYKAAHIWPLFGTPNYTRQQEQRFLQ